MKDKILKHTGLTEKQFYAKYSNPEDFFNSKEGIAFKKAQNGFGFKQPGIPQVDYMGAPQKLPVIPDPQEQIDAAQYLKGGDQSVDDLIASNQQITQGVNPPATKKPGEPFGVNDALGLVGPTVGAVTSIIDEKKRAKEAKMWQGVTDLQLKASRTKPERYDRKYVRPEDQIITGEELFPVGGVGTNPIAQDGSMIGGNPTEIQNTYDPYDIYTDGGYEPLNDSNLKNYQMGGALNPFTGPANTAASTLMDNNAGSQIGALGDFIPIPGVGTAGRLIGGQLDKMFGPAGQIAKAQAATNRNIQNIGLGQQAASVQAGFSSHLEHGGFINPQMITHYGKYSMKELMKPDPTMDTLQGGGEIKSLWGGGVKPQSYNPYMGGSGITYNSYGQSHRESDGNGRTGIGISVAQNGGNPNEADVEIERREPIATIGDDKVVYGNLFANADLLGDPKAKGKRFKNYVADLNKQEVKHTTTLDKNTKDLNELKVQDPYDKLQFNSYQSNMLGSNMNLKSIADKKQKAAHLQNAINETRDELSDVLGYTVSAEQLSKDGKIVKDKDPVTKIARDGMSIAQDGKKMSTAEAMAKGFRKDSTGKWKKVTKTATKSKSQSKKAEALDYIPKGQHRRETGLFVDPDKFEKAKAANPWFDWSTFDPTKKGETTRFQNAFNEKAKSIGSVARIRPDDDFGEQTASARLDLGSEELGAPGAEEYAEVEDTTPEIKKNDWTNVLGAALPYIRPSNAMGLDPNQLMGEMYGLSNNQVEPVQTQSYQPQLDVPYDISLQDQLNQVTSQTRGAQRLAGYNPAAQAAIAAQSYAPANQILGEQFRQNQAMKANVYDRNRATMNQAKMTNLGLYDTQAQRQGQAVANTKAVTQAALNSISDKYQKNALENKTLQTYENLYNYRYGHNMRAYNVNPLFNPTIPTVYDENEDYSSVPNAVPIYDKKGKIKGYQQEDVITDEAPVKKTKAIARNGSIVASLKRM